MGNNKTIGIHFGALADPISKQLDDQGFKYAKERVDIFQMELDAITRLRFGSHLLTDSIADKLYQKLHKTIVNHVAKNNNLQIIKP